MPQNELTLAALCGLETDGTLPIAEADRAKLMEAIHKAMGRLNLSVYNLDQRLLASIGGYLRKPVADILGEAWRQRKELREIAEKGEDGRDVEGEVELYKHSIKFGLKPTVKLLVNGKEIRTLTFHVDTELELDAIELVIRNACITQIKAGELKSNTTFKCEEFPLMAPCKKKLDLRLSMDLPRGGIRLGGPVKALGFCVA